MAKKGFNRNAGAISNILHNDPGLQAALKAVAEDLAKEVGGEVVEYDTDRYVAGVKVEAWKQARDGVLTKAAGSRGKTLS
jgi:hypothetical protein